ncbi:hypothetical protein A6I85_00370 [Prescottella equi]|nr:hypothetical protein A6I85_00370 [Prescottella equi]
MSVHIVRFRTSPEQNFAAEEQLEALFAGMHTAASQQMQCITPRETDNPVFALILECPDGARNPLRSIPAADAFRSWIPAQADDDPTPRSCPVLRRYSA